MNNLKSYTKNFFKLLDLGSDEDKMHFYKEYIASAAAEFLDHATKEKAYEVYSFFLDSYRINISGDRSFIDLLDVMRRYEENAAVLSDKQRDHYIHSVNVFLLGLSIYSSNSNIRRKFKDYLEDTEKNKKVFKTIHEEFFFRWGMSSLFHDIGYPVEIVNNQLDKFIGYIAGSDIKGKAAAGPFLDFMDFGKINSITGYDDRFFNKPEYICMTANESGTGIPTYMMACNISRTYMLDYNSVKETLGNLLETMQKYGFVDHGFYSSLILLKWYGELILKKERADDVYYSHILDAAAAIYMHNAYRNVFMKKPYSLPNLNPSVQPFAYLLIFCDEAQEWNRKAYGEKTRQLVLVDESKISIGDNEINLHYITKKGVLNETFVSEKKDFIYNLLVINDIFPSGMNITATTRTDFLIREMMKNRESIYPRLLLEYIEMIASKIHEIYVRNKKLRNPDAVIEFPEWAMLPDSLKYSNVRQARDIARKLEMIDCYISEESDDDEVKGFSKNEIEYLAAAEHGFWMDERLKNGWTLGNEKDIFNKKSPYLVAYDILPEDVKELDRDTIRNIMPLLSEIGLKVYRKQASSKS